MPATGPISIEGKSRSSQNSLKHGLYSTSVVLPNEEMREYISLLDGLHHAWRPQNQLEVDLTVTMANTIWRICRIEPIELQVESKYYTDEAEGRSEYVVLFSEEDTGLLDRLQKTRLRLERQQSRLLADFERARQFVPLRERHIVYPNWNYLEGGETNRPSHKIDPEVEKQQYRNMIRFDLEMELPGESISEEMIDERIHLINEERRKDKAFLAELNKLNETNSSPTKKSKQIRNYQNNDHPAFY